MVVGSLLLVLFTSHAVALMAPSEIHVALRTGKLCALVGSIASNVVFDLKFFWFVLIFCAFGFNKLTL